MIQKRLHGLLSDIIEIDGKKPELDPSSSNMLEEFKEGLVEADTQLTFLMKQNQIYSLELFSKQLREIESMKDVYQAKLMPLSNQSLLVVGGQSTEKRSDEKTQVKRTCCELYWNDFTSEWRVK
jgi:hypothetical protein